MQRTKNADTLQAGKPKTKLLAVASLLILLVSAALGYVSKEYAYHRQTLRDNIKSVNGVWDLQGIDFTERIEFIDGELCYITGALLTPNEFEKHKDEAVTGHVPSGTQAATARLIVLVAPGRYMLSGSSIDYSERIYVNGELRAQVGRPGLTKEESIPGKRYIKFEVDAPEGVIEIVRQSSNFVHRENSSYAGFWIGSPENMGQMIALQELPAGIISGLFLALFLIYLIAWLLLRVNQSNLWFALVCLAAFFIEGTIGHNILFSMFPGLSWSFAYSAVSVCRVIAGLLVLVLVSNEFPGLVQKWAKRIFTAVYAAVSVFYLFAGTKLISQTIEIAEVLLFAMPVYCAVRLLWLMRSKGWRCALNTEQKLTIFGASVAFAAFLHDALYYLGIHILSYEIADIGVLALVLFQMAAMFYGTMKRYSKARREAEAVKRQAEEQAAKINFYRKMGHDLRTPLTIVSTNIQTARRRPDEAYGLLTDAQGEIMKMAEMISGALKDGDKGAGE